MLASILLILSQLFNLAPLHEAGFHGEGITIAVIDVGFFRANDPTVFPQDHIVGEYDLVHDDYLTGNSAVTDSFTIYESPDDYHGTCCLSTMLYHDQYFCGTAPGANYILIRTEDVLHENIDEVDRLARGIRLADQLEADIITISLGYSTFDDEATSYTYDDMNGTSPAAIAVNEAVEHGRLVCVSAGNDGNKPWHYISTPADAEWALTVGAVKEDSTAAAFSSWGPTADGRTKPEVSALGQKTVVLSTISTDSLGQYINQLVYSNGTSFACPEVAGMAACLWQALPHLDAKQLRQLIIESCSQYTMPDCQIGHGIPNAWTAYQRASGASFLDDHVSSPPHNIRHVVYRNGQLLIEHDGFYYTILGTRL